MSYLIDTNVLIELLRGNKKVAEFLENLEKPLFISGITEIELLSGKECKQKSKKDRVVELILLFEKINPDNEINQLAAELRREFNVGLIDAIIAATAFREKLILITLDKDFLKVKNKIKVRIPKLSSE